MPKFQVDIDVLVRVSRTIEADCLDTEIQQAGPLADSKDLTLEGASIFPKSGEVANVIPVED
ncbi:hypothetical protein [Paenibacillus periandrae]|uniref:hypothetical protein n=1 Tax=Paenibacillus periandrae TaxID=1761741 RepID=UPI001F0986DC|nr:hypothetical protein [Paenibacillus periandrae]